MGHLRQWQQQRRNTIKLNKFANFRNTYFQIPTIQIYTSLQQPRHYFFSTQALLDDVCIFSQKLSLETSTTVYYSTTCYYATTSGVCKNSVKIPSCTPPQASSKSTTLQQLMSIFRISPFQHSVFKSNPAGTGLEKKSIFNPP